MRTRFILSLSCAAVLAIVGCSKQQQPASVAGPVIPRLIAEPEYHAGDEITLRLEWPKSHWRLSDAQKDTISADEFWPFHVRINGRELRIRSGLTPFAGLASDWTLSGDLYEAFQWLPGEYRVTYVLKGVTITHPGPPRTERQLDEWRSNEVVVRVVDGGES